MTPAPVPRHATMAAVLDTVCAHYDVSPVDLKSHRRTKRIYHPRQVAMCLGKRLTPLSTGQIGRVLGGRDHTTIIHGIFKIEEMCRLNAGFCQEVEALERSAVSLTRDLAFFASDPNLIAAQIARGGPSIVSPSAISVLAEAFVELVAQLSAGAEKGRSQARDLDATRRELTTAKQTLGGVRASLSRAQEKIAQLEAAPTPGGAPQRPTRITVSPEMERSVVHRAWRLVSATEQVSASSGDRETLAAARASQATAYRSLVASLRAYDAAQSEPQKLTPEKEMMQ